MDPPPSPMDPPPSLLPSTSILTSPTKPTDKKAQSNFGNLEIPSGSIPFGILSPNADRVFVNVGVEPNLTNCNPLERHASSVHNQPLIEASSLPSDGFNGGFPITPAVVTQKVQNPGKLSTPVNSLVDELMDGYISPFDYTDKPLAVSPRGVMQFGNDASTGTGSSIVKSMINYGSSCV